MRTDAKRRQQNPEFVRSTFEGIASRYDLANHVLSGGMDFLWRAGVVRLVASRSPSAILDVATGSGDLALTLQRGCPNARVAAMDFCASMLEIARAKGVRELHEADALAMPFQDGEFDVVTVSFGLRNMASWDGALREFARVLAPGGLLVVMDFSLPSAGLLRHVYRWYLHRVLPQVAGWLTGKPEAYEYLGESIEGFPRGQAMLRLIESCGFRGACAVPLACGIAAVYAAERQALT